MSDMTPLRIEWALATPWCPPALGLHLDGLLAWAMVQQAELDGSLPESYDAVLADLPLGKHQAALGWVWQASLVRSVGVRGSERRYMTSKTFAAPFAERMLDGRIAGKPLSTIDTVRGPYKNDAFWYTIEHAERCVAYCIGDPDRIAPLLDRITHLGKRGRMDHGRIELQDGLPALIVEDPDALTLWRQRHMPEPENGHLPVVGRLHPPYWKGEGVTTVWRPA